MPFEWRSLRILASVSHARKVKVLRSCKTRFSKWDNITLHSNINVDSFDNQLWNWLLAKRKTHVRATLSHLLQTVECTQEGNEKKSNTIEIDKTAKCEINVCEESANYRQWLKHKTKSANNNNSPASSSSTWIPFIVTRKRNLRSFANDDRWTGRWLNSPLSHFVLSAKKFFVRRIS